MESVQPAKLEAHLLTGPCTDAIGVPRNRCDRWTAVHCPKAMNIDISTVTSVTRDSDGIRATVQSGGVLQAAGLHGFHHPRPLFSNGNFPKRPDTS